MSIKHGFDFGRVDILAPADDHILQPVADIEEAVRVEVADIARVEPAFRVDRGGGGLGLVPVAAHDLRSAHDDFAAFACAQRRSAILADDAQIDKERRLARRAELGQSEIIAEESAGRCGFGQAVALIKRDPAIAIQLQQRLGHRRAATRDQPQAREISGGKIRMLADKQQHGGNRKGSGDAIARHIGQKARRIETAMQNDMPALLPGTERAGVQAADVEQRSRKE